MIKRIKILAAGIVFAALLGVNLYIVSPTTAEELNAPEVTLTDLIRQAQADGEGGIPNPCCPIWNWTYDFDENGKMTGAHCSTGGSYQCDSCSCPMA